MMNPAAPEHRQTVSDDNRIVDQVRRGNVNLFEELIIRHQDHVVCVVNGKVPRECVEEVAHDVFVRAFTSLSGFRGDKPFQHWLSVIAVRSCHDFWRNRYRDRETPVSVLGENAQSWLENYHHTHNDDSGRVPEKAFEIRELLDWAMDQLSVDDRMVLILTYLEDKSIKEAAQLLGISQVNVKVRSMRARKKMRKILAGFIL